VSGRSKSFPRSRFERFGWSENQLRWLLFNREENGLSAAVSGRSRMLIDATRFFEILQRKEPRWTPR